jgi:hypothetical protein
VGSIKHAIVGFFNHVDQLHGSNSTHGELFLQALHGGLKLGTQDPLGTSRQAQAEVENRGAENRGQISDT